MNPITRPGDTPGTSPVMPNQAPGSEGPGGSDGQIQYNMTGTLGGASAFTWDSVNARATHTNAFIAPVTLGEVTDRLRWKTDGATGLAALTATNSFAPIKGLTLESTVATGTAPFIVASTTAVTNLNADLLDGKHASSFDVATITFIIDGGGSAIATGIKGDLHIPFACTINEVTMLADQSGSIVVDIWADSYANFPPTDADSITASAVPTISTATKSQDSTLTGWTTSVAAGTILRFNVDSVTSITRLTISLKVTKT